MMSKVLLAIKLFFRLIYLAIVLGCAIVFSTGIVGGIMYLCDKLNQYGAIWIGR